MTGDKESIEMIIYGIVKDLKINDGFLPSDVIQMIYKWCSDRDYLHVFEAVNHNETLTMHHWKFDYHKIV